jgi:peptide-methionine (S)-S-oxide reductase
MSKNRSENDSNRSEFATIGGGCFWCTEAVYNELKGVLKVESGYSGGFVINPTYEQVCTGRTGHAEVVQITFNPTIISFREILEVFFSTHDPTSLNRQGADIGNQYRSVIFYNNEIQKETAEELIRETSIQKKWKNPIVTKIEPFKTFYKAEEYHRNYYKRKPKNIYCKFIIEPKIIKMRKLYPNKIKN